MEGVEELGSGEDPARLAGERGKELVTRVRAVLRRTEGLERKPDVIRAGDVEIDSTRLSVTPSRIRLCAMYPNACRPLILLRNYNYY